MVISRSKDTLGLADFERWWRLDMTAAGGPLPGLQRAVFNLVQGDGADGYDGVSELWFDSEPALRDDCTADAPADAGAYRRGRVSSPDACNRCE